MVALGLVAALAFALPALALLAALPRSVSWCSPALVLGGGLAALTTINLVTVRWGAGWDPTGWFIVDNLAFAAMTGAAAAGLAWARCWTGRPATAWLPWALAATALAVWLVGLWAAVVAPQGSPWAVFAAGTLWAAIVVALAGATLITVVRRQRGWRLVASVACAGSILFVLGLSVMNEWGGSHLPLSGVWLTGFATVVYFVTFRWLRPLEPLSPAEVWGRRMGITAREGEVLRAFLRNTDRTIVAETLFISPVTVKNHLASLYRRTGVSDLNSLLILARSQGWDDRD